MSWRFLNATARGTSHELAGTPCQDDCLVDVIQGPTGEILVAMVADGAGSASCAAEGAGLACETLLPAVDQWLRGGGALDTLTGETVEQWIADIRAAIETRATAKELSSRDFACTLAAAIVGSTAAAFFQIGDGAIVTTRGDTREVVFWPDGGEYANMTFFVTDSDWTRHLHFELREETVDDLALMTDGLQRLALHFETRTAYPPFFTPMFHELESAPPGFAYDLEAPLVAFLGSDPVNARTDDDKSLVLATRRPGAAHGAG